MYMTLLVWDVVGYHLALGEFLPANNHVSTVVLCSDGQEPSTGDLVCPLISMSLIASDRTL
jgi:hypothetical protein